ncbi:STAS domain-containing protein [Plantactinospora sp. KBS50]|uniref:STAS domain-containing protein n=1 Tax=Plantactinospora sp. KBS50 TaxID=2024580 RepID=UPI000BAB181D|nr:STAS domain-containing protein [Plantactinospora sp. KBS50]ASW54999.1 anti-anti-sigma factor [Plantactinospora sp. KBS50]
MTFSVAHARSGEIIRIEVTGELDMATVPRLNAVIDERIEDGDARLLVDLRGLEFCDSTGLGAFVRGDNLAAARGGWLRLTGAGGRVLRVLSISGLEQVLRYEPAVDPARHPDR